MSLAVASLGGAYVPPPDWRSVVRSTDVAAPWPRALAAACVGPCRIALPLARFDLLAGLAPGGGAFPWQVSLRVLLALIGRGWSVAALTALATPERRALAAAVRS